MFLRGVIVASLLGSAFGCRPNVTRRACTGGGGQSPLVTDAAMLRLDVYGADGHCSDGQLAAGAGAPILSQSYSAGEAIALEVPPGLHALVLSSFGDADATQLLGVGCTEADLSAGAQICFDLTIETPPDGDGDGGGGGDDGGGGGDGGDGCATACAPPHASGACANGACTVGTCASGYLDCNGSVDDGCECGTSCCINATTAMPGCLTTHTNGHGGTYDDCYPLATPGTPSTYDPNMALDAAASYTAQAGTPTTGWTCGNSTNSVTSVCKPADPNGKTGACTCWAYASGTAAAALATVGHSFAKTDNSGCPCVLATDPSWN